MEKIPTISWQELTGNKRNKYLHSAMLSNEGYVTDKRIRRIGDVSPTLFKVVYDRQYVMEYLGKTVCRPMASLGKEKFLETVSDAWDLYNGSVQSVQSENSLNN